MKNEIKRIAIFTTEDFLPPYVGGAELAIKEITQRMPDVHFDLYVARLRRKNPSLLKTASAPFNKGRIPKEETIGNVTIRRIGFGCFLDKYLLSMFGARVAGKIHNGMKKRALQNPPARGLATSFSKGGIESCGYDLVWAVMASYGGFAASFFKKKNPDVPFLLTLQEGDSLEHIFKRLGIFKKLFYKIFERADGIQAISSYLAEWKKFGFKGGDMNVRVIPNGVDVNNFQFSIFNFQSRRQELRKELGIGEGEKVVITTSRLEKKNAVDVLIKAMGEISNFKFPISNLQNGKLEAKLRLLIVGSGSEEKELKELAEKEGIAERTIFVPFLPHEKIPEYLSVADVFVRVSRSEGLGNSFLEAMAVGLPIIGTPVGGIPDFLKDGQTGLFCKMEDADDLAEKIKIILTDKNLHLRLSENGRNLVKEKYDWDIVASAMRKMFEDVGATLGRSE